MKFRTKVLLGSTEIAIEDETTDLKGLIETLSPYEDLPAACGHCKSTNLWPRYRTPKGYSFYSVKCRDCGHELKYGLTKEDHRLFPKGWEAPQYKATDRPVDNGQYTEPQKSWTPPAEPTAAEVHAEDVPF